MLKDDDLYGEGDLTSDPNFVVKAELRVPVRTLPIPAAQGIVSRLVDAYRDRLDLMKQDIEAILGRGEVRKALPDLYVIGDVADIFKAKIAGAPAAAAPKPKAPAKPRDGSVKAPGSRGGKYYRDKHGKIRYGTQPPAGDQHAQEATPQQITEHYQHMRPSLFLDSTAPDVKKLIFDGEGDEITSKYFDETDIEVLKWWENEGFDQYKEAYGLKDKDLEGDLSGSTVDDNEKGEIPHAAAINDYIKAIGAENFGISEDQMQECLDDLFKNYDKALHDPAMMKMAEAKAAQIEQKTRAFFIGAEAMHDDYSDLTSNIMNTTDPATTLNQLSVAMTSMPQSLIFPPSKGETKKGSLKGVVAPNGAVLDDKTGYLMKNLDHLDRLNAGQLSSVYVAAVLNSRWDPDRRQYDPEAPAPKLNEHVKKELAHKLGVSNENVAAVLIGKLDEAAKALGEQYNKANTGEDPTTVGLLKEVSSKAIKDAQHLKDWEEKKAKIQKLREDGVKAQEEDATFDVPPSMAKGVLGAMGKKSGEKHQVGKDGQPMGLFKHQRQSINWMNTVKRGLLALDAGMGKTPTLISFMEQLKAKEGPDSKNKRAILFLPPSLMAQWPKEIRKYAPGAGDKILNLSGLSLEERKMMLKSDMAKNAEYIIISSGTLTDKTQPGTAVQGQTDLDDDGTGGSDNEMIQLLQEMEGACFIDEAHQGGFKNANGVRHKLAKQVMKGREYSFGLTATPMPNHPIDLFHLTNLFTDEGSGTVTDSKKPKSGDVHSSSMLIGSQEEWEGTLHGSQFNPDTQSWEVTNPEAIVDLNKRVKPFVMSKLITDPEVVEDMKKALPPIQSDAIDITPSNKPCPVTGVSQYDYLRKGGAVDVLADKRVQEIKAEWQKQGKEMDEKAEAGMRARIAMTLQRQAAISPAMIDPAYKGEAPKITRICDDLVAHFQGGAGTEDKPIVIFSSYPKKAFPLVQAELVRRGIDPALVGTISGEVDSKGRAFEQDMTNAGKRKVLLVGTMSGGAGLNLQEKSNKMMFLDEPWHPAAKRQAQGRVWRTGQVNNVSMNTYRTVGSFDMNIESKIAGKQTMVSAMLGKPDPDAFKDAGQKAIKELGGRIAPSGLSDDQMKHLMGTMNAFDYKSKDFMGDDYDDDDHENGTPVHPDQAYDKKKATQAKKLELDPEANKKLGEKAGHLANAKFDEEGARAEWNKKQAGINAENDHEVQMNLSAAHKAAGNHEKADAAKRKAEAIKQNYPEAFGGSAKPEKKAKPVKKSIRQNLGGRR